MAYNFVTADRDQAFLMPPSLRDWLPEDHLAWFVLDCVEQFDLATFHARYRDDGWGRPAYDPRMLVALLLYAYCIGERSSRKIERRCHEDVAFRCICANHAPDHATIARFRSQHEAALKGLFTEALRLCAAAGLARVGVVAIDGTKMAANASGVRNKTATEIEQEIERILAEAAAVDAEEDARYGNEHRGDELPASLARREARLARLAELKARLEATDRARREEVERHEQRRRAEEASDRRRPGRPMKPKDPDRLQPAKGNTTDPDSRVMKDVARFVQGYNAQMAVNEDQVILAAELSQEVGDVEQLEPTLASAQANLDAAGVEEEIAVVVADAGYYSEDNARLELGPDLYIAPIKGRDLTAQPEHDEDPGPPPSPERETIVDVEAEIERRKDILDRWALGEIGRRQAAEELGLTATSADRTRRIYRTTGRVPPPLHIYEPTNRPSTVREWMTSRLTTSVGRALYGKRFKTIEPIFGQLKEARGFRRFLRRGLAACDAELKLDAAAHNLLKVWRARTRDPSPATT